MNEYPDPEKEEGSEEFVEDAEGDVDWLARVKRVTRIHGNKIKEVVGKLTRDRCCGCPVSMQDAGNCVVGKRRVCSQHVAWCSVCGLPTCHRHRTLVDELAVCHRCYTVPFDPTWILYVILAFFFLIIFLGAFPVILLGGLIVLLGLGLREIIKKKP